MAAGAAAGRRLKLILFLGSVREGRLGLRVARFIQNQLQSKYDITLFDPEELDLPLLKKAFFHCQDPADAPQVLQDCEAKLREAAGFIVVTAEYNHSIPPALSNMMDYFAPNYFQNTGPYALKPSGIVCYSPAKVYVVAINLLAAAERIYGGMRAAMQMRVFLAELGTMSVPTIFGIPEVHTALDEDGKPLNDHLVTDLNQMVSQLDWYAHAMKTQREKVGLPAAP